MDPNMIAEVERYWGYDEKDLVMSFVSTDRKRSIAEEVHDRAVGRYPGLGFPIPDDDGVSAARIIESGIHATGTQIASEVSERVKNYLCVEFRYCEKREILSHDGVSLAAAVADSLLALGGIPVPVTSFSVYMVKYQILDRLCKCTRG